jgi:hypothetical protein
MKKIDEKISNSTVYPAIMFKNNLIAIRQDNYTNDNKYDRNAKAYK